MILRVTIDGRELLTSALGESMTEVPADPAMHFRNGNIAISYLGTANPGAPDGHTAHTIVQRIAADLTPGHPIPDFG